jgi:hypothetical protein
LRRIFIRLLFTPPSLVAIRSFKKNPGVEDFINYEEF